MFFGLVCLCVGFAIASFYFTPQVRSYGLLHGYFPGIIYDEDVKVGWRLLWSRGVQATILFVVSTLTMTLRTSNRQVKLHSSASGPLSHLLPHVIALTLGASILLLLGYSLFLTRIVSTSAGIASDLGGHLQTTSFDIYFPWGEKEKRIEDLAMELEYHRSSLLARLQKGEKSTSIASNERIRVLLFRDAKQRKTLIGASRTNIAKPWQQTLSILIGTKPHAVMRHELVHVLLAKYGDRLLGVSRRSMFSAPNFGLVEGMAVALDESLRYEISLESTVRGVLAKKPGFDVSGLFRGRFHSHSGYVAYGISGSVLKYLIERDGIAAVLAIYYDPRNWIDTRLDQDIAQWRSALSSNTSADDALTESYISERLSSAFSVFEKRCPHYVANQYQLLNGEGKQHKKGEIFHTACSLFRLQPYNSKILELLLDHFPKDQQRPESVEALESLIYSEEPSVDHSMSQSNNGHKPRSLRIGLAGRRQLAEVLGDWLYRSIVDDHAHKGVLDRAENSAIESQEFELIASLYDTAVSGSGYADLRRRRLLKRYAAHAGPDSDHLLLEYLVGMKSRSGRGYTVHKMIGSSCFSGIGRYLMGKQLAYAAEFALGFKEMSGAIDQIALRPKECIPFEPELVSEVYDEIERDLSRFAFFSSYSQQKLLDVYTRLDAARPRLVMSAHHQAIRSEWLARMRWRTGYQLNKDLSEKGQKPN